MAIREYGDLLKDVLPDREFRELVDAIMAEADAVEADRFQVEPEPIDVPDNWVDFARSCVVRSGHGTVGFDPFPFQIALVDTFTKNRGTVVLKTRQQGISETCWIWFLWKACRFPGYTAALFSKRKEDTSDLARRVRLALAGLGVQLASDNLMTIELPNRSKLLFRTARKSDGRGIASVWDLLFDEAAFVPDIEEIYGGAVPSQSMLGDRARTLVVSTPDSPSGWYYDLLNTGNGDREIEAVCQQIRNQAVEPFQVWTDENGWGKAILHWRAHPIYGKQDDYLERVARNMRLPMSTVRREYDLDFGQSDRSVFGVDLVKRALVMDGDAVEFDEW